MPIVLRQETLKLFHHAARGIADLVAVCVVNTLQVEATGRSAPGGGKGLMSGFKLAVVGRQRGELRLAQVTDRRLHM